MKTTTKGMKITSLLVIITLLFLFAFNVTYSYFTATANANGSINFGKLDLKFIYQAGSITETVENKIQIYPNSNLARDSVCGFTTAAVSGSSITNIGVTSLPGSCEAYIRVKFEVYICKQISGTVYYVDSKGNYVGDNGNYVDESGNTITVAEADQGQVIDYAQYFLLGSVKNDVFSETSFVKSIKNNTVTYFYTSALSSGSDIFMGVSALKMVADSPDELLGTTVCMYLSFDGVQKANEAFKYVYDDDRGYYNGWV